MTSSKYTTRARTNSVVRARVAVTKADRARGIEIRRRKGRMKMFDRVVDHIFPSCLWAEKGNRHESRV